MRQVAAPSSVQEAVTGIEKYLLYSGIQIDQGAPIDGTARWMDGDGTPISTDLQIAGYYLTAMAWLASGTAYSPEHAYAADVCAGGVADWVAKTMARRVGPNEGDCAFDLAMAARGVAANLHRGDLFERRRALAALCTRIDRTWSRDEAMMLQGLVPDSASPMPDGWSARPGPHQLKAAAAILRLPGQVAGSALIRVARETCEYWIHELRDDAWPCNEMHLLLSGLEGMIILAGKRDGQGLGLVERPFARLMDESQAADGTLPETVHDGNVRSDVMAQALRVGLLLRGRGFLRQSVWRDRLDWLADALLGYVQSDGSVLFSHDHSIADTRCALFALQALHMSARQGAREPAPAVAFQLLV